MEKDTFIFIGRSGCGKGTQKDLLIKHLETIGMPCLSVTTGDELRAFSNEQSYLAQLTKQLLANGELAPSFLACSIWGNILMRRYQKGQSLVFDGLPRLLSEAYILETALQFLGFIHPVVVYLNVSNQWSKERLLGRSRKDDSVAEIEKRLAWFDTDVMPAVNYFRSKSLYQFLNINGEQTIEQVAKDIMRALPYLSKAQSIVNRSYNYVSSVESPKLAEDHRHDNPNQNPLRN